MEASGRQRPQRPVYLLQLDRYQNTLRSDKKVSPEDGTLFGWKSATAKTCSSKPVVHLLHSVCFKQISSSYFSTKRRPYTNPLDQFAGPEPQVYNNNNNNISCSKMKVVIPFPGPTDVR